MPPIKTFIIAATFAAGSAALFATAASAKIPTPAGDLMPALSLLTSSSASANTARKGPDRLSHHRRWVHGCWKHRNHWHCW